MGNCFRRRASYASINRQRDPPPVGPWSGLTWIGYATYYWGFGWGLGRDCNHMIGIENPTNAIFNNDDNA